MQCTLVAVQVSYACECVFDNDTQLVASAAAKTKPRSWYLRQTTTRASYLRLDSFPPQPEVKLGQAMLLLVTERSFGGRTTKSPPESELRMVEQVTDKDKSLRTYVHTVNPPISHWGIISSTSV